MEITAPSYTQPPVNATSDRFSLRRVGELYFFHSPLVIKQCSIYLAASLVCAILTLLPAPELLQVGLFTAVWTALPLMMWMSPCVFGRPSESPIIERLIPASAMEKMVFYLSYLLIIIPITIYALPLAARWIYLNSPSLQTPQMMLYYDLQINTPWQIQGINLLTGVAGLLTCLFVVKYARTNRVIKGVGAVILVDMIAGIIGGIYGGMEAFKTGFEHGQMAASGMEVSSKDIQQFSQQFMQEFANSPWYMSVTYAIFIIYCIVMLWLTYSTLKRRNI